MLSFGGIAGPVWASSPNGSRQIAFGICSRPALSGCGNSQQVAVRAATRVGSPAAPNRRTGITGTVLAASTPQLKKGDAACNEIHRTHVHSLVAFSNRCGANGPPSVSICPVEVDGFGEPLVADRIGRVCL